MSTDSLAECLVEKGSKGCWELNCRCFEVNVGIVVDGAGGWLWAAQSEGESNKTALLLHLHPLVQRKVQKAPLCGRVKK